jgi:hypothetical protein
MAANNLGDRYKDLAYPWEEDSKVFKSKSPKEYSRFIERQRSKSHSMSHSFPTDFFLAPTPSQKIVLKRVQAHLDLPQNLQEDFPFKIACLGGAGVGKSWIIRRVARMFENAGKNCLVTATTGAAAHLIGGQTLHSAFSIPFYKEANYEELAMQSVPSPKLVEKLQNLDLLIIDEVSCFKLLETFCNILRYFCFLFKGFPVRSCLSTLLVHPTSANKAIPLRFWKHLYISGWRYSISDPLHWRHSTLEKASKFELLHKKRHLIVSRHGGHCVEGEHQDAVR